MAHDSDLRALTEVDTAKRDCNHPFKATDYPPCALQQDKTVLRKLTDTTRAMYMLASFLSQDAKESIPIC
jgi:hypothetical protein